MRTIMILAACAVLLTAGVASAEVVGLPWTTWGGVSYSPDSTVDKGAILSTYAEQGVDWCKLAGSEWIFNTFAGLELSASDHQEEYWNNKVRPTSGFKFKRSSEGGAEIDLGIRGDYVEYFRNSAGDNWRAVAFIQWSAGGNWAGSK